MRIYLSGPMTGIADLNYPEFNRVAAILRSQFNEVYNPADYPWNGGIFPIRAAFAEYSKYICLHADKIVLLDGYNESLGSRAELLLAKNCGLIVEEWGKDTGIGIS